MIELRNQLLLFQSMSNIENSNSFIFHDQVIFSFNNIQLFKKSSGLFSRRFFGLNMAA